MYLSLWPETTGKFCNMVFFFIAYLSLRHVAEWRRGTLYCKCRCWREIFSRSSKCVRRNWVRKWNMLGNRVGEMLRSLLSWGWWAIRCKRKIMFLGRSWLLKFTKTSSRCWLDKNNVVVGLGTNQESMLWLLDIGARRGNTDRHSDTHPSTTWRKKSHCRAVANVEMPWQIRVTNTENIWT